MAYTLQNDYDKSKAAGSLTPGSEQYINGMLSGFAGSGGATNYAPPPPQTAGPAPVPTAPTTPMSVTALNSATGAGDPTTLAGGMTPSGAAPGNSAINNVPEQPAADPFSGVGLGLSALGGGAALGNQEAVSADSQSGGMLRGLGARRPPMDSLVLGRKAY